MTRPDGALMPLFRKKPILIEAWQNYTGDPEIDGRPGLAMPAPDWLNEAMASRVVIRPSAAAGAMFIDTPEGVMRADVGDWIIQGVAGELYPCRRDIFAATYEPAIPTPKE